MAEGIDYSYARPKPADIVKAGKEFVVRYITPPGKGAKGISQAEYDALKAAGLEIVVVWEGAAGDPMGGKNAGIVDATAAQAGLKAIVGLNDRLPVYFAIDWDASEIELRTVRAYFDGVISILGLDRVGVYGGRKQVKFILDAKRATYVWQTYAWSKGVLLDSAHLYQYKNDVSLAGSQVDLVKSLKPEYGQTGVSPKAPMVTGSIKADVLKGSVTLAPGAKIASASVTVVDSNGKKTTATLQV